eukprot:359237-Chlamydomonas_euryale.AAC.2
MPTHVRSVPVALRPSSSLARWTDPDRLTTARMHAPAQAGRSCIVGIGRRGEPCTDGCAVWVT